MYESVIMFDSLQRRAFWEHACLNTKARINLINLEYCEAYHSEDFLSIFTNMYILYNPFSTLHHMYKRMEELDEIMWNCMDVGVQEDQGPHFMTRSVV